MTRRKASAKAPGRLDFLGGVADYSGSLVLEMPLRLETTVTIQDLPRDAFVFTSRQEAPFETDLTPAISDLPKWVRYLYGSFLLFCAEHRWAPRQGLSFSVDSRVPLSMGVSSSAALEVATMRALEAFSGKRFKGTGLARLAQRAENDVVGAPCGLMDQLASAYGTRGRLLPILCRPDVLHQSLALPSGVIAVGWPSGVKHAVSDSPYATARAGAFMGKAIVNRTCGRNVTHATELRPGEVRALSLAQLPETILGAEFIRKFGAVDDPLTAIEPGRVYPVRSALLFPVEEHFRVETATALLSGVTRSNRQATLGLLGELLHQSHAGYSSIGLGCAETDQMVAGVRGLGPAKGFYGARVSGGGSGGTVVVLLERASLPALGRLARRLRLPARPTAFLQ